MLQIQYSRTWVQRPPLGPPKIGRSEVGPKFRSSFSWVGDSGRLFLTDGHCSDVVANTGLTNCTWKIRELKINSDCYPQLIRTIVKRSKKISGKDFSSKPEPSTEPEFRILFSWKWNTTGLEFWWSQIQTRSRWWQVIKIEFHSQTDLS